MNQKLYSSDKAMFPIMPSLSYNIDPRCNMRCTYCPPYYENYQEATKVLDNEVLEVLCLAAAQAGIRVFRISGGEPLLSADRVLDMTKKLRSLKESSAINIRLNTNGLLLANHVSSLRDAGIDILKVSLDALDEKKFAEITGVNRLQKILDAIDAALDLGMRVELNMVYMRETADEVWDLLDYCIDRRIPALKVLDLVQYNNPVPLYWEKNYLSPEKLITDLRSRYGPAVNEALSSGRGVEMLRFRVNDVTSVLVKDSRVGTSFSNTFCAGCSKFPCQEGFYNLTVNSDGILKPCRLRNDISIDLPALLETVPQSDWLEVTLGVIQNLIESYYSEMFFSDGWSKQVSDSTWYLEQT